MDETIQRAFDAELNRLEALNISAEELEIARRYYSQKEREGMSAGSFCGPHRSFPITSQADVSNAARLIGHADNPDAVKACIKRKAKANGWKLPDSWTSDGDRTMTTDIERAKQAATHPPFTGMHSHGHPHEIDGYGHEHQHEHANDNMHDHVHEHHRSLQPESLDIYLPITRIDQEKREVVLTATAERFDAYGTVIGYDGSKEAFGKWRGNVREMHDPHKAVGRALVIDPQDETKELGVTLRVSRGAEDTWQKVLDGTLTGASIGARNGKWGKRVIDGKEVPFLERYDLVELSLVDNPACPGCDIKIVRNDNALTPQIDNLQITEVVDNSDPNPQTPSAQAPDVTRAGARISHATQGDLHSLRDGHLQGAKKTMDLCGCDECMTGCSTFDPDGDGDIDIIPSLDWDGDGGMPDGKSQNMSGGMNYAATSAIERQLSPMLTRVNAMLSSYAARPQIQGTFSTDPIVNRIADVERAFDSRLTEVRSLLSEVKGLAEKIAAQPMPGGPIMTPVDKRLATSPQQGYNAQNDIDALTRASQLVPLSQEDQIALAAEIIKRQNRG